MIMVKLNELAPPGDYHGVMALSYAKQGTSAPIYELPIMYMCRVLNGFEQSDMLCFCVRSILQDAWLRCSRNSVHLQAEPSDSHTQHDSEKPFWTDVHAIGSLTAFLVGDRHLSSSD